VRGWRRSSTRAEPGKQIVADLRDPTAIGLARRSVGGRLPPIHRPSTRPMRMARPWNGWQLVVGRGLQGSRERSDEVVDDLVIHGSPGECRELWSATARRASRFLCSLMHADDLHRCPAARAKIDSDQRKRNCSRDSRRAVSVSGGGRPMTPPSSDPRDLAEAWR
jgi:hypothetical protein